MKLKVVLVTGIGGNVGQGILRIIKSMYSNIFVIGVNVEKECAGMFWCDKIFEVPYALDEINFISKIVQIVDDYNVQLIIPSTDYESSILSKNRKVINAKIAVNEFETVDIFLDKYKTFTNFIKAEINFCRSSLPSIYKNEFKDIILKPREGRGSRGVLFEVDDLSKFSDDEYMVQERHFGEEITTAVYVSYKSKKVVGFFNLKRKLQNGYTSECEVYTDMLSEFEALVNKIVNEYNLVGSFNIQSIVDEHGNINPFEINCRISGTNSIRHNLGFMDVKATIDELLFEIETSNFNVVRGKAFRFLADVIQIENTSKHFLF